MPRQAGGAAGVRLSAGGSATAQAIVGGLEALGGSQLGAASGEGMWELPFVGGWDVLLARPSFVGGPLVSAPPNGGGGLALGGLLSGLGVEAEGALGLPVGGLLTAASAGGLFLLTVAVTPANIYMFTHGAVMSGQDAGAALGLSFHCARFGIQVVLLSLLATLARDSFYYAWGDQLD